MKRTHLGIIFALLLAALPAYAENARPQSFKEEFLAGLEAKKEELRTLRSEAKERLGEARTNAFLERMDALKFAFETTYERLENISLRIEARANELADTRDVSRVRASLELAKLELGKSRARVERIITLPAGSISIQELGSEALLVREELRAARAHLVSALLELKVLENN